MKQNLQKPVIPKKLALLYTVLVCAFYITIFIAWRISIKNYEPINWPPLIAAAIFIFLLPLLYILNKQLEHWADSSPEAALSLSLYRRLAGAILLVLPFALVHLVDINLVIGTLYASHGYEADIYGSSGLVSAHEATYLLLGLMICTGLFLIFLGKSGLISAKSLGKLVGSIALSVPLTFICLLFSFASNYGS